MRPHALENEEDEGESWVEVIVYTVLALVVGVAYMVWEALAEAWAYLEGE